MSVSVQIADAIVSELNAGGFSLPVTAERKLLPVYDIKELHDLTISVVPGSVEIVNLSREMISQHYHIDIGVQKKIGANIDVELEPLLSFVEEIADFLNRLKLTGAPDAVWTRTNNEPLYDPHHLQQQRLFTSLLTITYKTAR